MGRNGDSIDNYELEKGYDGRIEQEKKGVAVVKKRKKEREKGMEREK